MTSESFAADMGTLIGDASDLAPLMGTYSFSGRDPNRDDENDNENDHQNANDENQNNGNSHMTAIEEHKVLQGRENVSLETTSEST